MTDASSSRLRTAARATVATGALLAGSLLLAFGSADLLTAAANDWGIGPAASPLALTVASLLPPLAFAALRTRYATDAGLRMLLAGLALAGASIAALWLTGTVIDSLTSIPLAISATYLLGLAAIASSHMAALLAPLFVSPRRTTTSQPSYRRDDGDHILPSDGGIEDDDLEFLLDDRDR